MKTKTQLKRENNKGVYLVIAIAFLFGSIIPLYKAFSMWDVYSFPYLLVGLASLTVSKECFKLSK